MITHCDIQTGTIPVYSDGYVVWVDPCTKGYITAPGGYLRETLTLDARAEGAPTEATIWLSDGTLVKISLRNNTIHIRRTDGGAEDLEYGTPDKRLK